MLTAIGRNKFGEGQGGIIIAKTITIIKAGEPFLVKS